MLLWEHVKEGTDVIVWWVKKFWPTPLATGRCCTSRAVGWLRVSVTFDDEFSCLKYMISTCAKDFSWEKWPKFSDFNFIFFPRISKFLLISSVGNQEYRRIVFFFSTFISWLNYFLNDCHIDYYITKSFKRNPAVSTATRKKHNGELLWSQNLWSQQRNGN